MLGGNLLAHLRSLRTRLMLWNAGAVALTGILILLAMRAGVRYTLIGDLDQVLREDLKEIKLYFHEEQPYQWRQITEDLNRKAAGHDFHRWFVQFYDLAGEPTWSSINTPPLPPLLDSQKKRGGVQHWQLPPVQHEHGILLRCSDLPRVAVSGNRHHLWQVVSNLLDNAIKFSAARTDCAAAALVAVELTRDEHAGLARLIVRDSGVGIDAEHLPQIFDRFFRGDQARGRDNSAGGTGLGLSICKAIVDAHGGQIGVESHPGRGSRFTVTLPLAAAVSSSGLLHAS